MLNRLYRTVSQEFANYIQNSRYSEYLKMVKRLVEPRRIEQPPGARPLKSMSSFLPHFAADKSPASRGGDATPLDEQFAEFFLSFVKEVDAFDRAFFEFFSADLSLIKQGDSAY